LSLGKTMQLRMAAAILSRPRILVLSPVFDMVAKARLEVAIDAFAETDTTVIYFSNRPEDMSLGGFLWLGRETQRVVQDRAAFDHLRTGGGEEVTDGDQR
jgi:putative ABC transport system ATP-binding protein